jgi:hypothetical protein
MQKIQTFEKGTAFFMYARGSVITRKVVGGIKSEQMRKDIIAGAVREGFTVLEEGPNLVMLTEKNPTAEIVEVKA